MASKKIEIIKHLFNNIIIADMELTWYYAIQM